MKQKEKDQLNAAFLNTNYVVNPGTERIVIRIGERSLVLDKLLEKNGVSEWAFITAYNPYSQQIEVHENEKRQADLCSLLKSRGLSFLRGFGGAARGEWPPEPSLLVFGLGRPEAIALARDLKQNAIVCGRSGAAAELVWCRG